MAQPQTLESLVAHYRRAITDPALTRATIELEVRFRKVAFNIFETILKAFVAGKIPYVTDDGVISNMVSFIMEEEPAMRRGPRPMAEGHKINLIRLLSFDHKTGEKIGEEYYKKWPLAHPFRAQNSHALNYIVGLSAEEPCQHFTCDSRGLIRIKSRASFKTRADAGGNAWRIDLTIVRTERGSNSHLLKSIVKQMFQTGKTMTPANMLTILGHANPVYSYELELEYMPGKQGGDTIRPSEITELVSEILQLAVPEHLEEAIYQAEIFYIAEFFIKGPLLRRFEHGWGLKRLVPQAIALTRGGYKDIYPPTGYFLLDKADGFRSIASVRNGHLLVLADKLLKFDSSAAATIVDGPARVAAATIVDGELIYTAEGPTFYAFDVLVLLGENLTATGYETRVARLEEAIKVLREFKFDAHSKPIVHLTGTEPAELRAQFLAPVFQQRPYETDGRILVEPGKPYGDTQTYKWKPIKNTTIDFLCRRAPAALLAQHADAPGCELHILFVGINLELFNTLGIERIPGYYDLFEMQGESYFPIQFSPSDAPLAYLYQHPIEPPIAIDGKIIELQCAGGCAAAGALNVAPSWQLIRIREDRTREGNRYYGNDFRIAELTWLNFIDPFDETELWQGTDLGYFASEKSELYRAQTAFTSFIKSQRIETHLHHTKWVIDAAIGKGQDLGRYIVANVRNVVGIDKDRGALSELVRRKYSHAGIDRDKKFRRGERKNPTTLFVLRADLTSPHAEIAAKVQSLVGFPGPGGADALVINLAIHYLAENVVNLRNFAALCWSLVKIGGMVIITTMFGNRVHELLIDQKIETGESWNLRQNGILKYSIRRNYVENELMPANQQIGILLPFSEGRYYDEYLVNTDTIIHEFSARGFKVIEMQTFDNAFDLFRTRNPNMYMKLTDIDFQFLRLYGEIILKRET